MHLLRCRVNQSAAVVGVWSSKGGILPRAFFFFTSFQLGGVGEDFCFHHLNRA